MKKLSILFVLIIMFATSCVNQSNSVKFIATSAPLAMILEEITGSKIEILLPKGASPHTYTPKPSDALKVSKSECFFYVSKSLDGWAEKMESKKKVEVFRLIPRSLMVTKDEYHSHEHHEEVISDKSFNYDEYDSHFWTDPLVVKHILPLLLQKICEIDPKNSQKYKTNADNFAKELIEIDSILTVQTESIKDKPLFLFHPSFLYFIKRYGLNYGGSIEWNPGTENTPNTMADLINKIKSSGVKSIFSEPQLPNKAAIVLAEQTGTKVFQLDPLGGSGELSSYYGLMMYNMKTLKKALD